jgi:hypothetical protein
LEGKLQGFVFSPDKKSTAKPKGVKDSPRRKLLNGHRSQPNEEDPRLSAGTWISSKK